MRLALALAIAGALLCAQVAREANERYQTKDGRDALAAGMSSPERSRTQRPAELVEALGIAAGSTVADAGTGPGYMLPYLSRAVGERGRILAEDIQRDFLDRARAHSRENALKNVEFILGTETDTRLPPGSADVILVLDAYHHFNYPEAMLASLRRTLKPGGRLAIVDFYRREGAMGGDYALHHIRLDKDDMVREVEANGFRLIWTKDHTPGKQYIAMFRVRE